MNNRNLSLPFIIVAIILGITIYKHFDFDTFTFKETWLDYLYIATFIYVMYILLKKKKVND
ncbi:hypothetical protein [Chryseobacterium profundimaris]|uniref:Uncharacterized protein n=1 Tax=Chryseobacterium profundimaris TaxID=1387275 RepID=A0ABY1P3V1_9FLAO|nr:hypothetical protein [Chryseobacterium profundimaris]SMP25773.1 hypothetical protein SAMN06264346_108183 [Chryseobacterium profundimaris]